MKEINEILARIAALPADERAVLATVVALEGSGYRLPGARMLISSDGMLGTVSGGCLEADVVERAKRVVSGRPEVFVYDTTGDEASVFSLNMGCRGVIRILLESVSKDSPLFQWLRSAAGGREGRAIATLISAETDAEVQLGGRLFVDAAGHLEFDGLNPFLRDSMELRDLVLQFLASGEANGLATIEPAEGSFEFSFESIEPTLRLLVFGAGADAVPMASIAASMGWQVTVLDHREALLTPDRFPAADLVTSFNGEGHLNQVEADGRTAAVLMTHNYERDRAILPALLRSEAVYVGALGPKRRTEQLIGELAAAGTNFTENELARLYAPIGLDIGAQTPDLIALAIAAEIQSVLKNRNGGHLRDRKGSIYGRK